ncbi:unnamed protein product [Blepharisma stoltei]|uniref:Acyltransferase 3 domain-containing protein n=1 Tax=Blepharisma stoltei TaxID=1481888 RepID=A0AAU9J391_9CILI|nr:unnamed protein product [Blepharisma stoltei]
MKGALLLAWIIVSLANQKCMEAIEERFNQTMLTLFNKNNYPHSVEMFLFNGKGLNDLGHYRSCLRQNNNYFLLRHQTQGRIYMGLCVPQECSQSQTEQAVFSLLNYNPENSDFELSVQSGFDNPLSIAGWLTLTFLIAWVGFCIAASYLSKSSNDKLSDKNERQSTYNVILNCCSLSSNYARLVKQRVLKKGDNLSILDSLRFFMINWVIVGHAFTFYHFKVITNLMESPDIASQLWVAIMYGGYYSVDSFFFIGGLLTGYLILKTLEAKRGHLGVGGWKYLNIHRYLRIIPLYGFLMIFYNFVIISLGNGPLWSTTARLNNQCDSYWWTNFLFLNNFIPNGKGNGCFGVGWYLANDMQFFWLGQLLIILYYNAAKWLAWVINLLLVIAGLAIGISLAAENHFYVNVADPKMNVDLWFYWYYTKPYIRFLPYFLGVWIGFIYLRYYKNYVTKEEDTYPDPFCNGIIKIIRDTKFGAIISFLMGWITVLFFILIQKQVYNDITNSYIWTDGENAVFQGSCRLGYTIGLAMILLPLLFGRLRFVAKILSLSFWEPLGKLSFAVFLGHIGLLTAFYGNSEGSAILSGIYCFKDFIFLAAASWAFALFLFLFVEMPCARLEGLLWRKKA